MQIISDVKLTFLRGKELPKPTKCVLIRYRIHIEKHLYCRLKFNMSRFESVCIFSIRVCVCARE